METFAYLHIAQEYEYPEEKEIKLNWVNPAALTLISIACSTWGGNIAGAAQAMTTLRGDTGADVIYLQDLLRKAGYFPSASTGFFGEFTEAAVHDFQRSKGLSVDGVAGYHTLKALGTSVKPVAPAVTPTPSVTPTPPVTTPLPSQPGVGNATLGFGDSGVGVTRLQDLLRRAGYLTGPSTGFFGAVTRESIKLFQRANGLPVDGFAGRATIAALQNAPAVATTPTPGSPTLRPAVITRLLQPGDSGEDVKALQQRLTERKYYTGPVTGFYGDLTEAAVRNLQRSNNLPIDGFFGAKSAAVLR
ncbi:MAG: peptidoglycan-binding protein [Cyanobacteria bacterium CAN_BIN43]|nr:peptidoglycan-binding protein [Cyanobacteria bacterium CAN_BIN43]